MQMVPYPVKTSSGRMLRLPEIVLNKPAPNLFNITLNANRWLLQPSLVYKGLKQSSERKGHQILLGCVVQHAKGRDFHFLTRQSTSGNH